MKKLLITTFLLAGSLSLSACDVTDVLGLNFELTVVNNSSNTVTAVYVSPCEDTSWGSNRLSGTIAPGASKKVNGSYLAGCYDLRADGSNSANWVRMGWSASPGAQSWTITN